MLAIVLVVVVGFADLLLSPAITLSVFYLVPLALAAWVCGRSYAWIIAAVSIFVSVGGDLATRVTPPHLAVMFWNAAITFAFYVIVIELLARLRSLEGTVRERTADLTHEMAERRRLERELLDVSEREQQRIGHDLHDVLVQHLTAAALAAKVVEEKLMTRALPEASAAGTVVQLIEDGLSLTRNLSRALHGVENTPDGLMQALEELADTTAAVFGIDCQFVCDSPVLIHDKDTGIHLYRIAREAATNAAKHSKAERIVIHLETHEEGVLLEIRDAGTGLQQPRLKQPRGMGLRIMA